MPFLITCAGKSFETDYSKWRMIRIRIAELCMIFIENIANKKLNISPDGVVYAMSDKEISKENDIIQGRIIINQLNDIVEDKKNLSLEPEEEGISALQAIVNERNKELNVNDYLMIFECHTDYLIKIGIYGVVSLLNKGDCEGYYSVGNSFDILKMLNTICKNNDFDRTFIEEFREVFEASVSNGKNVSINCSF
jgi:hypothetical protein